ncbi:MAG: M20/M25/M40 family metallo-hydrolase [Pyrinomonadaceae bacterium]
MKVKFFAGLFLLMLVATNVVAQQTSPRISTEAELKEDLNGPCKNDERLDAVKKLFVKMGAPESEIKAEKTNDVQNVIFTKKGKTNETVIIGGHFDKVNSGCGIIDNWSGIVILAHLLRTISDAEMQKTYVFAAFDREEEGLKGSKVMAKAIPKESRSNYCSMVNLDNFGLLSHPVILENASSSKMVKFAQELGKELTVSVTPIRIGGVDSDSSSFRKKGIPAFTLSSISSDRKKYMHTANDKIENVNMASVRVGYLFAREYITRIDAGACNMFAK